MWGANRKAAMIGWEAAKIDGTKPALINVTS
jgi:hypothetical protein